MKRKEYEVRKGGNGTWEVVSPYAADLRCRYEYLDDEDTEEEAPDLSVMATTGDEQKARRIAMLLTLEVRRGRTKRFVAEGSSRGDKKFRVRDRILGCDACATVTRQRAIRIARVLNEHHRLEGWGTAENAKPARNAAT